MIEVNAGGIGEAPEQTTVRGRPGQWGPDDRDPDATMLLWDEVGGQHVRASYRGLSTADVVAILDTMTVRLGGVNAGFDLPAGGLPDGLAVLGEATSSPDAPPTTVATTFGARQPDEPGGDGSLLYRAHVEVVSPDGELAPDYLVTWFLGGRDDGGVARWWWPGDDDNEPRLRTVGPDGRAVVVEIDDEAVVAAGLGATEDVARDMAASVVPVTAERLAELWEGLVDQWVARDLVVSVPTSGGTVELRGSGAASVLCLRGESLSCWVADHPDPNDPPDGGNFDGQWQANVPTGEGDQLVAVSDRGPIVIEVQSAVDGEVVRTYPRLTSARCPGGGPRSWRPTASPGPSPTWPARPRPA